MARPPEFFESDITDLSQPFPYLSGQRTHHVCPSHGARSFLFVVPNRKWPGLPSLAGNQSVSPRSIPLIQLAAVLYPARLFRSTTMTPKHLLTIAFFCLLVALPVGLIISAQAQKTSTKAQDNKTPVSSNYRISGPYTHKNLTIFLVHGKDRMPGKNFLTLQEALAQKKVRVYETKDVNELAIKNFSNQDVYVQAGDIVRGGEQDRMISIDFIVPPRSGRMPIAAFCVESGRWNKRGEEQAAYFSSSENFAATKQLKLAAKIDQSQDAVWEKVSTAQAKLTQNLSVDVVSASSPSSYELAVENSKVKETAASYVNALNSIL